MIKRSEQRKESATIISLGCSRNLVDSEKIAAQARARGVRFVGAGQADTVMINTCAFTRQAKEESVGVIMDAIEDKKKGLLKKIVVFGCLVERYGDELAKNLPEVDDFFTAPGFKEKSDKGVRLTAKHLAYLKISEGCLNRCSYCAIPLIKGPLQSRVQASILDEARFLDSQGVAELILVGQDITSYGLEKAARFKRLPLTNLLEKILRQTKIPWIRLLYLHPKRLSEDLLDLISGNNRICSYLDVPFQHSSDKILSRMKRGFSRNQSLGLINQIRRRLLDVVLRTSLIVGFPGETERDFADLLDFVKTVRFDRLGAFVYSREEGTDAYEMKMQISEKVKQFRLKALMQAQQKVSQDLLRSKIGSVVDILIDGAALTRDGMSVGRSQQFAPSVDGVIYVKSRRRLSEGDFIRARINRACEHDLFAEEVR